VDSARSSKEKEQQNKQKRVDAGIMDTFVAGEVHQEAKRRRRRMKKKTRRKKGQKRKG
jgi:hypothetical protein